MDEEWKRIFLIKITRRILARMTSPSMTWLLTNKKFGYRIQNLDSTVRYTDRRLPVTNIEGEVLFKSFSDIFDGNGGMMIGTPRIYSFNKRNIMTDPHWWECLVFSAFCRIPKSVDFLKTHLFSELTLYCYALQYFLSISICLIFNSYTFIYK